MASSNSRRCKAKSCSSSNSSRMTADRKLKTSLSSSKETSSTCIERSQSRPVLTLTMLSFSTSRRPMMKTTPSISLSTEITSTCLLIESLMTTWSWSARLCSATLSILKRLTSDTTRALMLAHVPSAISSASPSDSSIWTWWETRLRVKVPNT